jgi:hypothetical protein
MFLDTIKDGITSGNIKNWFLSFLNSDKNESISKFEDTGYLLIIVKIKRMSRETESRQHQNPKTKLGSFADLYININILLVFNLEKDHNLSEIQTRDPWISIR